MQKISAKGKIINYLILAAVLLPLIFIAEVVFVEKQYIRDINQAQYEKLKAETEVSWLSGQTAYLRNVAQINAILLNSTEDTTVDLRSFLTTDFVAVGYAQPNGKVWSDTSGSGIQDISQQPYFAEAVAGREFVGQVPGNQWLLNQEVTVIAVPAIVRGTVTGVFYGVIRPETLETIITNLVPAAISEQEVAGRWLAWLGVMYLLGIIPLLLLVYLLRRPHAAAVSPKPVVSREMLKKPAERLLAEWTEERALVAEAPERRRKEAENESAIESPEAIAVRKIAEMIALNSNDNISEDRPVAGSVFAPTEEPKPPKIIPARKPPEKPAAETAKMTPAAVIDKVLAAAAYKGSRAAAIKEPLISAQAEPSLAVVSESERVIEQQVEPEVEQAPTIETVKEVVVVPQAEPAVEPQRQVQETIADLPAADKLTNLYTRSIFEKKIAAQYGKPDSGFLVLSIDGMKVINDFLGRAAGDAIIMATADILRQVAGSDCLAARLDGDKFVVLLDGVSTETLEDLKKDVKYNLDLHNLRQPELPLCVTTGSAMAKQGESLAAAWDKAMRDMESRKAINRVEARKFIMQAIKRHRRKP